MFISTKNTSVSVNPTDSMFSADPAIFIAFQKKN